MKIKLSEHFRKKLYRQVLYIALDKPEAARKFKNDLLKQLHKIPEHPYSFRQSIFFNDENIRDLVFKGYVVTFRINQTKGVIEVFGFNKFEQGPNS